MYRIYDNTDLVGNLEELGLSKYEAGAYLTLIRRGSLAASEIAYYANLPRTKVYPTLKKLEKKRLSTISQQKPLICNAISPKEAFNEIVKLYERRLKNMKKIIDKLQRINDEGGRRPKGSEEKRYLVLDPNSALEKVVNVIAGSRSSINAILDPWGMRLFSQCHISLIKAITNGVKIKLVLANQCIENENLFSLPEDIDIRIGDVSSNIIIIDSNIMISIDSNNGKAAVFSSMDIFGSLNINNFQQEWTNAMEVKYLTNTNPNVTFKAIKLTKIIENAFLSTTLLESALNPNSESAAELMEEIEKSGIKISKANVDEILTVIDSALRIRRCGSLKHDKNYNIVSIQPIVSSCRPVLPWAYLLFLCLKHIGIESKIMQNSKDGSVEEVIHLKLLHPIP